MKLEMYRGDSAVWNLECKQSDGTPLDITAGTLWFTAKSSARQSDLEAAFQKTVGVGITVTNGPLGLCSVELSPVDTEGLYAPSELMWDLQFVTTGDKVFTLAQGSLLVKPDVSISR